MRQAKNRLGRDAGMGVLAQDIDDERKGAKGAKESKRRGCSRSER